MSRHTHRWFYEPDRQRPRIYNTGVHQCPRERCAKRFDLPLYRVRQGRLVALCPYCKTILA